MGFLQQNVRHCCRDGQADLKSEKSDEIQADLTKVGFFMTKSLTWACNYCMALRTSNGLCCNAASLVMGQIETLSGPKGDFKCLSLRLFAQHSKNALLTTV